MTLRYPFLIALLSTLLGSFLLATAPVAPQEEIQPPQMCHYDMSGKQQGGCSCAGQKHEKCGIDPDTGKLLRDNRMCKAYCDMSQCHCCIS